MAEVRSPSRDAARDGVGEAGDEARPVIAVYGTLRRGERNHALLGAAEPLGTGTIRGRLWALDATAERAYGYPALVAGEGGPVVVELYRLAARSDLQRLDDLEAYDPADEAGSEYLRRRVTIEGGPVASAWAWVIARAVPADAEPLPGGDWVERRGPQRGPMNCGGPRRLHGWRQERGSRRLRLPAGREEVRPRWPAPGSRPRAARDGASPGSRRWPAARPAAPRRSTSKRWTTVRQSAR